MFKSVTLEISLKPFKKTDELSIRTVCRDFLEQWKPLLKNREEISVMLWTSDGSEILDYRGNLNDTFEWCRFLGTANLPYLGAKESKDISLHKRKRDYIKDPPIMTYGILKRIVSTVKEEGKKLFPSAKIRVGETFDIGPEFALSDFKYNRHTEITSGTKLDTFGFVDATAILNGDKREYAAYKNGIPNGTPFGTFLGRQTAVFISDMGFDYLWLSNGMGFSANPWDTTGKIFDGENFHPERLNATKENVFAFWKLFREACPDIPLETRGTNNSAGIDYATDGVPLYDIYNADLNIMPPPNSPWAALNDNYGLEVMGHMTRICNLPGEDFLFRYYIHDPWWCNSPWYDRYDGAPGDIYLPMAVSRIDENGKTKTASRLNLLSIDNSFGNLPDLCVYEPLPHLLKAEKDAADEPAPFVWVYPMREYTTASSEEELRSMYFGDRFIESAINCGFPLNCVVSTDNYLKHRHNIYEKCVLITPVPTDSVRKKLLEFVKNGGNVIMYGFKNEIENPQYAEFITVDMEKAADAMLTAIEKTGYILRHECLTATKPSTLTLNRSNNAFWFSAYSADTTCKTSLCFPLGAPILLGCETRLENGLSTYRFSRGEHRECRIFVSQEGGVISAREEAPVSEMYRRRFRISGLNDATVYYFPESYCEKNAAVAYGNVTADVTPTYDESFKSCYDKSLGFYYKAEHVTGARAFLMPFPDLI